MRRTLLIVNNFDKNRLLNVKLKKENIGRASSKGERFKNLKSFLGVERSNKKYYLRKV